VPSERLAGNRALAAWQADEGLVSEARARVQIRLLTLLQRPAERRVLPRADGAGQ